MHFLLFIYVWAWLPVIKIRKKKQNQLLLFSREGLKLVNMSSWTVDVRGVGGVRFPSACCIQTVVEAAL